MTELLDKYGPTCSVAELVTQLNRLYHEKEAESYELTHPEIFEQLPELWAQMLSEYEQVCRREKIRILNYGCGTGFEAQRCLRHFGVGRIDRLVCYDPSTAMLAKCAGALRRLCSQVEFTQDLATVATPSAFDILVTNSVLHHLPQPFDIIRLLSHCIVPGGGWLCGHEPSRRFLANLECRETLRRFQRQDRWRRLVSPRRVLKRAQRWLGLLETPEDYAAARAVEMGLFAKQPPPITIRRLVDFHVAEEPSDCRGFDFREMQKVFSTEWELAWVRTYSYMGSLYEGGLPPRWRRAAAILAEAFPMDGGNLCMVWRRL